MNPDRLLAFAQLLCGRQARASVFEPLVADWHREWRIARTPWTRAGVAVRGALGYTLSLALSLDTRDAVRRHSITIGWFALPVLTLIGALLANQPIIWRPWVNPSPILAPLPAPTAILWSAAPLIEYGLTFAVLPVCLLLALRTGRVRQAMLACALAVGFGLALDGWIGPFVREARIRHHLGLSARHQTSIGRATTSQLVALAADANQQTAAEARLTLRRKMAAPLLTLSLALIGMVIGRSRALAGRPVGLRTIVGYWWFGWVVTSLLGIVAGYLSFYLALRPYGPTTWLEPVVLLAVGVAAWIVLNRRTGEITARA